MDSIITSDWTDASARRTLPRMKNMIVIEADRRAASWSASAAAERPGATGAERPVPTCECPEYCLLDHSN